MPKLTCDWHACDGAPAVNSVRCDIPRERPYTFTTLLWARCAAHTPDNNGNVYISPLGGE